jgi:putative ABC transport system substrate-binding protein
MNTRRQLLMALGAGTLARPLALLAQQPATRIPRIAFLGAASAAGYAARIDAFRAGFRDLGYEEGRNITIEYRWAEGQYDRLPELAAELVRLKVDVIVTHAYAPTLAAKRATAAVPIPVVMTNVGDAVAWGIVASLSRPGGNITGDTFFLTELAAKRLEVLKDAVPRVRRIAVLVNPDNPGTKPNLQAMDVAAKALQLVLERFDARGPADLESAFAAMVAKRCDALTVLEDPKIIVNFKRIAELAAKQRLPSIGAVEITEAGGMIGYGVNFLALYRRAAVFVDKILRGARPADIPVERPTRFELAINMNTAKALGLKIPQSVLLRADRVIE